MTDQPVAVVDTIALLDQITANDITAVYVKGYHSADGRGGGLLRRTTDSSQTNEVTTFKGDGAKRWVRDLNGGTLDAYMAGAYGDGRLTVDGKIDVTSNDDTRAIQALFDVYTRSVDPFTDSATLHIRIGDGVFRVGLPNDLNYPGLDFTQFPSGARGWVIDGTGATLLGGCPNVPVIDATDSRFGTFLNLQIIGAIPSDKDGNHYPSCGLRIGRKADNEAANQMATDHVGIRGLFKVAACLNVASEQFSDTNCEFTNDAVGPRYGYAGDAYNMLQWERRLVSQTLIVQVHRLFTPSLRQTTA